MQKTKLGGRFWLALTVFSLVGQVAWVVENMYFNVFIYKMFHATAAQISLMVAASAVVATLTTILIGALSDRVGKRKIFICVGYLLWGISILSFALIRVDVISPMVSAGVAVTTVCVNLTILMDCVMTFFGSTANDACFNAWLTDSTDDTNRGAAEGINAMMPMMAILVVFGGFMFFDLEKAASWVTIFTIIGVVVILIGIVGFWLIREPKVTPSPAGSYWGSILYGFRPSVIRRHKVLYLTLLAFAGWDEMLDKEYGQSVIKVLKQTEKYLKQGRTSGQFRYDEVTRRRLTELYEPENTLTGMEILIAVIAGLAVMGIFIASVSGKYSLKGSTYSYDLNGLASVKLSRNDSHFVREHVTRVKHPDPPSSSHGGSSHGSGTHVSSSGATHGGGGRSF